MQAWNTKKYVFLISLIILSVLGYFLLGYQIERSEHISLVSVYALLFTGFYFLVSQFRNNIKLLSILTVVFRLLFIVAIPSLSQDFYRFIWDGRMILAGYSPYLYTPVSVLSGENLPIEQANELIQHMGPLSAGNLSNYPPVNQFCFVVAGFFSGNSVLGSVVVLRILTILADIGILAVGSQFLKKLKLPSYAIFWYLLNPFVIIELTGNLHFESIMLFFLLLALYLVYNNRWKWGAVALALSVSVKLIPLMFLPLFFRKLGAKKWIAFCALVGALSIALFTPFLSQDFFRNYTNTVALWFQKFEFNASIYYLVREVGYLFRGYNEIAVIGIALSLFVLLFAIYRSFRMSNTTMIGLITSMLLVVTVYFFTATTVHPWYIATPLLLSIFTPYKYAKVWSLMIILSYLAYITSDASENYLILLIEYTAVYAVFFYEMVYKKGKTSLS